MFPILEKASLNKLSRFIFPICAVLCLHPFVNGGMALILGVAMALIFGNPFKDYMRSLTKWGMAIGIVGLGAGMDLVAVLNVGMRGIGYTVIGLSLAFGATLLLMRLLKTDKDVSILIASGTAICGATAIAAVSPVINARASAISAALGIVFLLNALALVVFPWLGALVELDPRQFGLWSGIAIHDTSSVVGAAAQMGAESLDVGTSTKLARALWIVPMVFLIAHYYAPAEATNGETKPKVKFPLFILGFLGMAAFFSFLPSLQWAGEVISFAAKRELMAVLFLIGASLDKETIKTIGWKPFVLGAVLWIILSAATLLAIKAGFIA